MKYKLWILLGISAVTLGTGLAMNLVNGMAGPMPGGEQTDQTGERQTPRPVANVPLALYGTRLMAHPEVLENVEGSPTDWIDQNQYDQIRKYFLKQIAETPVMRDELWKVNFSSMTAYESSVREHRQNLRRILGLVELRPQRPVVEMLQNDDGVRIENVQMSLQGDFALRTLVFVPEGSGRTAAVIAIPRANQSPEEFAGIVEGMITARWLKELLGRGVTVAIPEMVERRTDYRTGQNVGGYNRRRILWRLGFLVGRTLVGLEVQQVVALADYLSSQPGIDVKRIAVWGGGQGGMTALYAAAVDERLAAATVLDYFEQRELCWKEPVDRVIYGQLNEFGDAELAALIAPRPLTIVTRRGGSVSFESARAELERARRFYEGLGAPNKLMAMENASGFGAASAVETALMLGAGRGGKLPDITFRVTRDQMLAKRNEQFEGLYYYLRGLCEESRKVRRAYWNLNSTPRQERARKVADLHKELAHLMGVIPNSNIPLNPRTILVGQTDNFLVYDIRLDAAPGLEVYGQLLVPRSVVGRINTRLPAMICQHGFGQAPKYVSGMTTDLGGVQRFGQRLAERGYVVFAPYLTVPSVSRPPDWVYRADLINPIVREAAAVGMMRTSIELAKLHRIVDFLQSLPFVNPERMGYYGLSYGGYSAEWMPPLEPRLKLTIISGDFNNRLQDLTHVAKAGDQRYYWDLPDEDFYNWNVLNRFTDPELIAAMWPRPVCIEWGLDDPTTTPAWHKEAWGEEKKFIEAWGMDGQIVSDDFVGVHEIHGIGTFFFMDRWLRPERSAARDYGCDGDHYCDKEMAPEYHGYAPSSTVPYLTHEVDSSKQSAILGRFYVADTSPEIGGMALKLSKAGHPGELVVDLGSKEWGDDLGELKLDGKEVSSGYGLWYELKLEKPIHLDPRKLYWFAVRASPGSMRQGAYTAYGPKPLGGTDYPHHFGLSFRTLTKVDQQTENNVVTP